MRETAGQNVVVVVVVVVDVANWLARQQTPVAGPRTLPLLHARYSATALQTS